MRCRISNNWPIRLVPNTKVQLRLASKGMLLISICPYIDNNLLTLHSSSTSEKHCECDSDWARCERACILEEWEQDHRSAFGYKFRRNDRAAKTLGNSSAVQIAKKTRY
ncbi:hypothetical protein DPMN_177670 [Dreissena polymorpha]|uniref:Uncharacterized protein n=1 Tax=Dreissena polymorpha TaxID=45954 RepID=A0A9D4EDG2_DREPO|nr:hypothetical protein DPMN_177670 [Dreissena polymorpha]